MDIGHVFCHDRAMKTTRYYIAAAVCCLSITTFAGAAPAGARQTVLQSPDGTVSMTVGADGGQLRYSVLYDGVAIIRDAPISLILRDQKPLGQQCRIASVRRSRQRGSWQPVYAERHEIPENYNALDLELVDGAASPRSWHLRVRAYDEGVAWAYHIPMQTSLNAFVIERENTTFRFVDDFTAWAVYSAQGRYAQVHLSQIKSGCERPLTIQVSDDRFVAVCEARLVDSARMKLGPVGRDRHTLVSQLSGAVTAAAPWTSPWRVVMVGRSPGQLLERNYLLLNLNAPCALADTSWIKPGKVIREVTLTTQGGKACVDFAARHNLQFVEFDAGWYGHESAGDSDATTVTVDPKRSTGPLDLPEVIRYAEQRGVGIIVYVNRRALEKQLDQILPLYRRWGIKGVKYGFVQVGSQRWTRWLHDAVRTAAENRLMVDVHDEYRPTGFSRTYPNLMTQEGIGGDETRPTNQQTLTILFTRMLAGAGDNTICYYDDRVTQNACHAYQLAKAVCLYSPWQFLYWYDRPTTAPHGVGGAGNSAHHIGDEPELEFFDHVPTVWDETRVLEARIGCFATIARRHGTDWFVGCMNGDDPHTAIIPLSFLDKGTNYMATRYTHDPTVPTRTHVRVERLPVTAATKMQLELAPRKGAALWIHRVESPAKAAPAHG